MANITAEAPARPKNTRKPAKSAETRTSAPAPHREAADLQAEALQILMYVSTDLAEANLTNIPGALHAATEANNIAYCMCHPEDSASEPPSILSGLELIGSYLDTVGVHLEAAGPLELHTAISASALLELTQQLARRLHAAIVGLPGTIEELRALTTYAGAKPYRDRPRPPIRREPVKAKAGQLTRAQLLAFVETMAGSLGTLNETLMMAQTADADWQRERLLDAGQLMAQSLGAMADHMAGSDINGSIGRWMCGPSFDEMGRSAA